MKCDAIKQFTTIQKWFSISSVMWFVKIAYPNARIFSLNAEAYHKRTVFFLV